MGYSYTCGFKSIKFTRYTLTDLVYSEDHALGAYRKHEWIYIYTLSSFNQIY